MTRIVSGFAGSLTLAVPRSGTRPTSDRVREAIFSALDARDEIRGAHVLDLYAGSGSLGLEAASRGAASVVLVERNAAAAAVCRKNTESLLRTAPTSGRPRISVAAQSVQHYLESVVGDFDLVFLDPPYDLPGDELDRAVAALAHHLSPGATVMIERSTRSGPPTLPSGLELDREKKYGETTLWWATAVAATHRAAD
ncbi:MULTISPECIES: 16S rRNA (guanine(966)-N(2))-methyltransferase RsmD [unclassified Leifsonia]|uniref:16S rRNA (guanine(966)-N(2))-methyltransferase RsmD n=1 Tax=unclassified Leifsonia TaxID=2663824 RepID=UPI0006FD4A64|nr:MULTISPECIES: 16S rRNA (guanine(966)-N(2))-methyltransferase RsmD [unclassified Leifsonia]KQX07253.1 16S rRNA (guanine(966)-N(2))-methyltransferase RsmD [Leifsonia sp. Root1293]KRA11536.1 16S rRNA (guanine(966)-N(2))-methyltransferase RsmD [Leifsonia sp. Root60]